MPKTEEDARRREYRRRAEFVHGISSPRYGQTALRALAIHALDIGKLAQMSDEELLALPGIGQTGLQGVRKLLREYDAAE